MNVAYPFHPRYSMLYTGYRSLADYSRKSCICIYHPPPTNVNDDSTLNFIFFPYFIDTFFALSAGDKLVPKSETRGFDWSPKIWDSSTHW